MQRVRVTAVLGVAVRHIFDRRPPPEMAVFFSALRHGECEEAPTPREHNETHHAA